jgi:hypothetical protein
MIPQYRRIRYLPLRLCRPMETPSEGLLRVRTGDFHAHGWIGGNELRMRALGLFEGGGTPFSSRVLWISGLQSQSLSTGEDFRIDHTGSIRASVNRLGPSSVTKLVLDPC